MELAKKFSVQKPSGMIRVFQAIEKMQGVLNLSIGEPDFATEPDIVDEAAKFAKEGFTHYPPLQGFLEVREAACAYWERHHGFKADPDEVYISVGGLHIPWLAFGALLNPGDEVMLIEPYFTPYEAQIRGTGGVPVAIKTCEENNFAPTIDELRAAWTPKTRGIILNYPDNPSGRVASLKQLEEIAKFVEEKNMFVLSDEIYESMIFKGEHVCFANIPGMKERTLLASGVSKSHCMTGWRIGYVFAPKNVINTMCVLSSHQTYGVNTLSQKAAAYAMNTQDEKVKARAKIFGERMKAVEARLNSMKGVKCHPAEGAFYLFPDISGTGLTSEEFTWQLLNDAKVAVVPGNAFGQSGEGYIRIACTLSMEDLMKSMDKMENFCKKF
ncbi:MAG: pyridoxal phosphate-dependent aminotransferase [Synergistales bacterium]|nr:pyridoxal phosphate-dependent aminotransferase [Synergistales bacterium]MDY6400922.1 pyridoxal phosphate-dependent aminotransferase [Synergistales bacterium]MDY6405372.1 pyridoxal phosphate-dependent aminotransferase [Synergistales bacterium]MDY6410700.1 pyridoxal phosphate-dependent aminotransferase [Synergistales bacterium]MDY6413729.1 pyridoxal phosphate-dependent aminotransferase [Synergistales bacterium]